MYFSAINSFDHSFIIHSFIIIIFSSIVNQTRTTDFLSASCASLLLTGVRSKPISFALLVASFTVSSSTESSGCTRRFTNSDEYAKKNLLVSNNQSIESEIMSKAFLTSELKIKIVTTKVDKSEAFTIRIQ